MIRLPPSVICLAQSDVSDYDERRKQRQVESINREFARFEVGAEDGPKFGRCRKSYTSEYDLPLHRQSEQRPRHSTFGGADSSEDHPGLSRRASPENILVEAQQSSSPPKDAFHYGGFVGSSPVLSSPFAPGDISTPPRNPLPASAQDYRLRHLPRSPLPRSPLFFSHNASSSPERQPTSSLTPRVASRVANHITPGLLFSQPARRANFRHQTNSFSFDSSERASTAYEQDRISSLSTTDTTPRPANGTRLRDELRGSSLSSSQLSIEIVETQSHSPEESEELENVSTSLPSEIQDSGRTFIFSSPQLPLPAPFSTSPRSVSDADSMPSSPRYRANSNLAVGDSGASPVRSPLGSPDRDELNYEVVDEPQAGSPSESPVQAYSSNLFADSRMTTPVRFQPVTPTNPLFVDAQDPFPMEGLPSDAARTTSRYGPRSPSRSQRLMAMLAGRRLSTPTRDLPVYDDSLPAISQPQTPAHVPEARHQSRYHPSYTAPVTRSRAGLLSMPSRAPERQEGPRWSPSQATRRRGASPVGLRTDGFRGLYGGRENGDEEQNWVDGVRFDHAEVRLWGLSDAAADGRTLRDTPEREEWRVGRH